jgi:hypothetical protein
MTVTGKTRYKVGTLIKEKLTEVKYYEIIKINWSSHVKKLYM